MIMAAATNDASATPTSALDGNEETPDPRLKAGKASKDKACRFFNSKSGMCYGCDGGIAFSSIGERPYHYPMGCGGVARLCVQYPVKCIARLTSDYTDGVGRAIP